MPTLAPPIEGTEWLNSKPLTLESLQDRVILLVFWSFGCEASQLRLRQVAKLAEQFGDDLAALGIHTPRLDYESAEEARQALVQFNINIPVLHDQEFVTWSRYNPKGWPATVVIAPGGDIVGTQAGTTNIAVIEEAIEAAIKNGGPVEERASLELFPSKIPDAPLAFPTKVICNDEEILVITDPGNNQILLASLDESYKKLNIAYRIEDIAHPSSVAFGHGAVLYFADAVEGTVKEYNFSNQQQRTLTDALVSPTALAIDDDGSLAIADAGAEQIIRLRQENGEVSLGVIAGSGLTGCLDGPASKAELAQPVAITRSEAGLLFCDAASSTVRLLTDQGKVTTISGKANFDWGLQDGPAHSALMQRPSDIFMHSDGSIIILDTGNNRLRKLSHRRFKSIGIDNLNRPSGFCLLPSKHIAIADTGNHRIVLVQPDFHEAWELEIEDYSA